MIETRGARRVRRPAKEAEAATLPRRVCQVFDLVVDTETAVLIGKLAERLNLSPSEAATRLLNIGVQAELFRQRWLAGMGVLSPRMQEAALLLLEGMTYREAAAAMSISYFTTQEYCQHVTHAFGQSGRRGLWRSYGFLLGVYSRQELMTEKQREARRRSHDRDDAREVAGIW